MSSSTQPPGWLPDPTGRHQYRYWDGRNWTANVSDNGVVSNDPLQAPTPPTQIYTPAAPPSAPSMPTGPSGPTPPGGYPPAATPYSAAQPPGQPYVAAVPLKKKGLNPFVLIIPAVVVVVAVVAFFTLAGGGGGDGTGTFTKKITNQTQLDRFNVKLKKGDLLRLNVAPEKKLDVQVGFVPPSSFFPEAVRVFSDQLGTDFNLSDQLNSELASDETDFFSDIGNKGKLVVTKIDKGQEGQAEKGLMIAPVDGTYAFLVRGFGGQTGQYKMTLTRTPRATLLKNKDLLSEAFDSAQFKEFFTKDIFSDFNTDSSSSSDSSTFSDFTTDTSTDVLNSKSG